MSEHCNKYLILFNDSKSHLFLSQLYLLQLDNFPNVDEARLKEVFATELEDLCTENRIIVVDGMVSLLDIPAQKTVSGSKRKLAESDVAPGNESEEMFAAIVTAVDNESGPIRQKKLRNNVMNLYPSIEESDFKSRFAVAFDELCSNGTISFENGMVTLLKAPTAAQKKMSTTMSSKNSKSSSIGSTSAVHVDLAAVDGFQMWRDGEKAWKDGTLDHSYLTTNPDKITRVFCGNLSLAITEEQLRGAIDGIIFIKWMTDKQTRKFYGSTFLEMKDPRAASNAVLLDKTKLLGRPLKICKSKNNH